MLRKMEKLGEQGITSEVEESNLFLWQRGKGRVTGSVDKGGVRIRNNQSDQLIGNLIVEQNICNKETGRRIEENNGLSAVEHSAKISAFYKERSEQGIGNMDEKRLGISNGHQVSLQSCGSNWRIGEIPSIHTLRRSLVAREGNGVDSLGAQEIWMGDQREQEQVEAGVTICIPGMDVQLNNNEDLIGQREKEGTQSISSKVDKINIGRKNIKDQKRGKIGWQAQAIHSIIQTRRTASIVNKQINEQSSENIRLDERNVSNEKVFD
ncbi:MAG: hypothetical protein EZS28_048437 [Streblomastix strix]|uniref:Uncharacterized protein n=1 Tax=Streblomastix strix TaxID=222440 RepID=A0A5J4TC73_9EUKA|nr:MAG: hypothetical protein EZS28_048437 [Streblomastix strix]